MNSQNTSVITTTRTIPVENIHSNLSPEILEITIDKLKIVLLEHESSLQDSNLWQTPLALLVTITLVLCTTSFKDFILIGANTWQAIFIISCIASFFWLIASLIKRKTRMSVDKLIDCMKKNA